MEYTEKKKYIAYSTCKLEIGDYMFCHFMIVQNGNKRTQLHEGELQFNNCAIKKSNNLPKLMWG